MKKLFIIIISTIISIMPLQAQEELTFHYFAPEKSPHNQLIVAPWIKNIEEESKGKLKIINAPGMKLGGTPANLYDQVVSGDVDIAWTIASYTPGKFPRTEVFELPSMITWLISL